MGIADPGSGQERGAVRGSLVTQTLNFFPLISVLTHTGWAQNGLWTELEMRTWPDCPGREIPAVNKSICALQRDWAL